MVVIVLQKCLPTTSSPAVPGTTGDNPTMRVFFQYSQNPRIFGVGRDFKDYLTLTPPAWAGIPSTRAGCLYYWSPVHQTAKKVPLFLEVSVHLKLQTSEAFQTHLECHGILT